MSGFVVDASGFVRDLNDVLGKLQNTEAAMRRIGGRMVARIRFGFTNSKDPYGTPWKPLSPATLAKEGLTRPRRPLLKTGQHLFARFDFKTGKNSVTVGLFNPFSAFIGPIHQFGTKNKRIPARPFYPIRNDRVDLPDNWRKDIFDALLEHIR